MSASEAISNLRASCNLCFRPVGWLGALSWFSLRWQCFMLPITVWGLTGRRVCCLSAHGRTVNGSTPSDHCGCLTWFCFAFSLYPSARELPFHHCDLLSPQQPVLPPSLTPIYLFPLLFLMLLWTLPHAGTKLCHLIMLEWLWSASFCTCNVSTFFHVEDY